jgi:hypothetical protein
MRIGVIGMVVKKLEGNPLISKIERCEKSAGGDRMKEWIFLDVGG